MLEIKRIEEGFHKTREEGMNAMEAVAWIAGEPHSSRPTCTSPLIAAFIRRWNNDLRSDDERELLRPVLPELVNTGGHTEEREKARSVMCTQWLMEENLPSWISIIPELSCHAEQLKSVHYSSPKMIAVLSSANNAIEDFDSKLRKKVSYGLSTDMAFAVAKAGLHASAWRAANVTTYIPGYPEAYELASRTPQMMLLPIARLAVATLNKVINPMSAFKVIERQTNLIVQETVEQLQLSALLLLKRMTTL